MNAVRNVYVQSLLLPSDFCFPPAAVPIAHLVITGTASETTGTSTKKKKRKPKKAEKELTDVCSTLCTQLKSCKRYSPSFVTLIHADYRLGINNPIYLVSDSEFHQNVYR